MAQMPRRIATVVQSDANVSSRSQTLRAPHMTTWLAAKTKSDTDLASPGAVLHAAGSRSLETQQHDVFAVAIAALQSYGRSTITIDGD